MHWIYATSTISSPRLLRGALLFIKPFYIRVFLKLYFLSRTLSTMLYLLRQHHLLPISPLSFFLPLYPSSGTFGFSLRLLRLSHSAFPPPSRNNPRRRHQQTSWLYRESRLDYESWLEAGRLAHRYRREVSLFPFFLLFPRVLLLTSPSSFTPFFTSRPFLFARLCLPQPS